MLGCFVFERDLTDKQQKDTHKEVTMYRIYRQSRSDHPRGFTGTLLRSEMRARGGHDNRTLIRLVGIDTASERLGLSASSLELGARSRLIPHYEIDGHLLFEPAELNRWIYRHRIDGFQAETDNRARD